MDICWTIIFDNFLLDNSNLLLDHETYYFDLKLANRHGQIDIIREYSARKDLKLNDMSPDSWHQYVRKLAQNDSEFQEFKRRYYRSGPANSRPCNTACKKKQ